MWSTLLRPDRAYPLLAAASAVALATAFVAQYGFDLQPCVLCLYQRWPYAAVIALAVVGLLAARRRPAATVLLALIALALVIDAGIAGFHVGVEQLWWQGSSECTGPAGSATTLEELRAQIMATPVVRCDDVAFVLFGISMAGYNMIAALALAAFALAATRRSRDARQP